MIYCQNCGKENEQGTNFCRFCGNPFAAMLTQQIRKDEYTQPRPYMWQTDEFQVAPHNSQKTQEIKQGNPMFTQNSNYHADQTIVRSQSNNVMAGYRCPRCGTHSLPYTKRQVSTAGWVTFAVLLVTTGIFFWVGLLIKENVRVCSVCNCRISY